MMTSSNGNIVRVTGHLCGEFTGPRWIPHTKASDAELWCLLWSKRLSKQSWGWWFETLSHSLRRHRDDMYFGWSYVEICSRWSNRHQIGIGLGAIGEPSSHYSDVIMSAMASQIARWFRRRSKKTSKLRVTGLCGGNPPVTSGFPSHRASDSEIVPIWWRHHDETMLTYVSDTIGHHQQSGTKQNLVAKILATKIGNLWA